MFDLTQPLSARTPSFPGDPQVRVEALPGYEPWQVSRLEMSTHSGTHLDAPRHRFRDGLGIGDFPPERFVGRGLVIDASGFGNNAAIPPDVLAGVKGLAWPGWFAVVRTGWDRYWGEERYFQHPFLSPELTESLIETGAGLVAIDALSVDSTADRRDDAHVALLGAGILIAENLCRLAALEPTRSYAFAFLPLALGDADGSPARVIAWGADSPPA
jgi:kynurenine formamidase